MANRNVNVPPEAALRFAAESLEDNAELLKGHFLLAAKVKKLEFDAHVQAGFTRQEALYMVAHRPEKDAKK